MSILDPYDVDRMPVNLEGALRALEAGGGGVASDMTLDPRDFGASTASLDNTAAFQAALDAVDVSGTGVILVPPGTWKFTGTLTIPRGRTQILRGCGRANTKLLWTTDLGAGQYAIKMAPGFPNQERYYIEHMTVDGPGGGPPPYGVAHALMYGIDVTNGVIVTDILVQHFYAAFVIGGNHSQIRDSTASGYYGIFYINGTTIGNHTFDTLVLYGYWACIGVQQGTSVAGESFNQVHWIDSPYGFYREPGSTNEVFIGGCSFTGCSVESIGNAFIYDEDATGQIGDNTFVGCGGATPFYTGTRIAGRPVDYWVRCGYWYRNFVTAASDFFTPGALGIFEITGTMSDFEWRWFIFTNSLGAGIEPVSRTPTNTNWYTGKGRCIVTKTNAACLKDDLLAVASAGNVTKATSGAPAGIAMHAANANDTVLMLVDNAGSITGGTNVNSSDATIAAGNYVKQDTVNAGQVVKATGPVDGVPVGVAQQAYSGGKVEVWLRGLH